MPAEVSGQGNCVVAGRSRASDGTFAVPSGGGARRLRPCGAEAGQRRLRHEVPPEGVGLFNRVYPGVNPLGVPESGAPHCRFVSARLQVIVVELDRLAARVFRVRNA